MLQETHPLMRLKSFIPDYRNRNNAANHKRKRKTNFNVCLFYVKKWWLGVFYVYSVTAYRQQHTHKAQKFISEDKLFLEQNLTLLLHQFAHFSNPLLRNGDWKNYPTHSSFTKVIKDAYFLLFPNTFWIMQHGSSSGSRLSTAVHCSQDLPFSWCSAVLAAAVDWFCFICIHSGMKRLFYFAQIKKLNCKIL